MTLIINILCLSLFSFGSGFEKEVKTYLDKKLSGYDNYEFEVAHAPRSYTKIEIEEQEQFKLNKGILLLPVKITYANNNTSKSIVTIKVKLYKKIAKSINSSKKNDNIYPNNFTIDLAEITNLNGTPINLNKDYSGYRIKQNLNAGTVLLEEHLELIPIIQKGEKAILHTGSNGVDVSLEVITRKDGITGEIITVVYGNKMYKAKVIDQFNLSLVE